MGYSIWLNFGPKCTSALQNKIQSIARRHSCPEFPPHLTLVGDMELDLGEVREAAKKFASGVVPPEISISEIGSSKKFFMTLFLAVDLPPDLQSLREIVAKAANPKDYELDAPHVSMAYGEIEASALKNETLSLRSEFLHKRLLVKDISIVKSSKTVPISDWESVELISLGQTSISKPL